MSAKKAIRFACRVPLVAICVSTAEEPRYGSSPRTVPLPISVYAGSSSTVRECSSFVVGLAFSAGLLGLVEALYVATPAAARCLLFLFCKNIPKAIKPRTKGTPTPAPTPAPIAVELDDPEPPEFVVGEACCVFADETPVFAVVTAPTELATSVVVVGVAWAPAPVVGEAVGTTVISTVSKYASVLDGPVVPFTTDNRKTFPPLRSTLLPR